MRVVLDTNVLVSAIFFSGVPARVLGAWGQGRFEILATADILQEYERVVGRLQRRFPAVEAQPVLDLVIRRAIPGAAEKSNHLVEEIERIGAEPFRAPDPLPPIETEEIHLICWLAIAREERKGAG